METISFISRGQDKNPSAGKLFSFSVWLLINIFFDYIGLAFILQGGYAANLAPAKLVGKLLNFFDSTAHRVVGGLPPPAPSASNGNSQANDHFHQQTGPRVSASQSTMAISSLMSSASMEPINDWADRGPDGKMMMHNRSVSEPDFGRTPRQVHNYST